MPSPSVIPPASPLVFQNGISHPELWLWDSWILRQGNLLNLYCLAVNRKTVSGAAIRPSQRNDHRFHVRRFVSPDEGSSWRDAGPVIGPDDLSEGSNSRNIWSGSATQLPNNKCLFCYTGITELSAGQPFVQSIYATLTDNAGRHAVDAKLPLLDSDRDHEKIRQAGYYLAPRSELGSTEGEDGGPISAWRDPFTFVDDDRIIHLYISAKTGPKTPAIAHATLLVEGNKVILETLSPPITLPDADQFTQAEVPKVYHDRKRDLFYLLISACDRLFEGQHDSDVTKQHRLYKSTSLTGPWVTYQGSGSILGEMEHLFGASLINADFDSGAFAFVAPYTEMAAGPSQLTFAPITHVNIYQPSKHSDEKRA